MNQIDIIPALQDEIADLIRRNITGDEIVAMTRERHPAITVAQFHIAAERALRSLGLSDHALKAIRRRRYLAAASENGSREGAERSPRNQE